MKRFATVSMILILFSITNILLAQKNDFNFVGAGARATGMGSAFIGVSDDATAISWNPAGLSQLTRPEASVVGRYTMWDVEYKDFTGQKETGSLSTIGLNFASLVVPFQGAFNPVIAVSFQNQLDFTSKQSRTYDDPNFGQVEEDLESDLMVHAVSLGYSMKFGPLHAGLAVSRWFSAGEIQTDYMTSLYGEINETQEHSFSGTSFLLGVLFDFENINHSFPFKLGVKFSPSFDLEDEVKVNFDTQSSESTGTIEMPTTLGFGMSFRILDALTIAADYEMINVKDKKIITEFESLDLSESNENMGQYRVGTEYLIITDNFVLPLRAGYKNNPTLRANIDEGGFYDDPVNGSSLNFGAGLIFNNVSFDVAYEYFNYVVKNRAAGINETETYNFITLSGIVYF